jgi:hypothetical protein
VFTFAAQAPHKTTEILYLLYSKMEWEHRDEDEFHSNSLLVLSGSGMVSDVEQRDCHNRHTSTRIPG